MKRIVRILSFILICFLSIQCQREINEVVNPMDGPVLPEPITAVLQGNVVDENGQPAIGVDIRVGNKTAITDDKGYFRIMDASLDKKTSLVTAEKAGYFKAYRTFGATSGANQVMIKLIRKALSGTIDATAGGEVSLSNGTKISLPANAVVSDASGSAYTGTVNVYAAYIDPTAEDISAIVPGSFMANDADGRRVLMESYGMMAVELESPSGEKLQIKDGSQATLTTPIPSSLQSSAPATLPLWYMNEQTGIWMEEGSATKSGSHYVGTVSHFSFWNFDVNIPAININLTLVDPNGLPIVHALVYISTNVVNLHGWTDSLGQVSGYVPSNENIFLNLLDLCGNIIYTQNIGLLSQDTNLGTITIPNTGNSLLTISGILIDCTGNPVTNGYAIIYHDNIVRYVSVNGNGEYSCSIVTCSTGPSFIEVIGVNEADMQQGNLVSIPVTSSVNTGNITACGNSASQFINYTIDGVDYSLDNLGSDSIVVVSTIISNSIYTTTFAGEEIGYGNSISFGFSYSDLIPGTYNLVSLSLQNSNQILVPPSVVVINNFPQMVGEFYEGSFSTTYLDNQSLSHSINGNFRIRKN